MSLKSIDHLGKNDPLIQRADWLLSAPNPSLHLVFSKYVSDNYINTFNYPISLLYSSSTSTSRISFNAIESTEDSSLSFSSIGSINYKNIPPNEIFNYLTFLGFGEYCTREAFKILTGKPSDIDFRLSLSKDSKWSEIENLFRQALFHLAKNRGIPFKGTESIPELLLLLNLPEITSWGYYKLLSLLGFDINFCRDLFCSLFGDTNLQFVADRLSISETMETVRIRIESQESNFTLAILMRCRRIMGALHPRDYRAYPNQTFGEALDKKSNEQLAYRTYLKTCLDHFSQDDRMPKRIASLFESIVGHHNKDANIISIILLQFVYDLNELENNPVDLHKIPIIWDTLFPSLKDEGQLYEGLKTNPIATLRVYYGYSEELLGAMLFTAEILKSPLKLQCHHGKMMIHMLLLNKYHLNLELSPLRWCKALQTFFSTAQDSTDLTHVFLNFIENREGFMVSEESLSEAEKVLLQNEETQVYPYLEKFLDTDHSILIAASTAYAWLFVLLLNSVIAEKFLFEACLPKLLSHPNDALRQRGEAIAAKLASFIPPKVEEPIFEELELEPYQTAPTLLDLPTQTHRYFEVLRRSINLQEPIDIEALIKWADHALKYSFFRPTTIARICLNPHVIEELIKQPNVDTFLLSLIESLACQRGIDAMEMAIKLLDRVKIRSSRRDELIHLLKVHRRKKKEIKELISSLHTLQKIDIRNELRKMFKVQEVDSLFQMLSQVLLNASSLTSEQIKFLCKTSKKIFKFRLDSIANATQWIITPHSYTVLEISFWLECALFWINWTEIEKPPNHLSSLHKVFKIIHNIQNTLLDRNHLDNIINFYLKDNIFLTLYRSTAQQVDFLLKIASWFNGKTNLLWSALVRSHDLWKEIWQKLENTKDKPLIEKMVPLWEDECQSSVDLETAAFAMSALHQVSSSSFEIFVKYPALTNKIFQSDYIPKTTLPDICAQYIKLIIQSSSPISENLFDAFLSIHQKNFSKTISQVVIQIYILSNFSPHCEKSLYASAIAGLIVFLESSASKNLTKAEKKTLSDFVTLFVQWPYTDTYTIYKAQQIVTHSLMALFPKHTEFCRKSQLFLTLPFHHKDYSTLSNKNSAPIEISLTEDGSGLFIKLLLLNTLERKDVSVKSIVTALTQFENIYLRFKNSETILDNIGIILDSIIALATKFRALDAFSEWSHKFFDQILIDHPQFKVVCYYYFLSLSSQQIDSADVQTAFLVEMSIALKKFLEIEFIKSLSQFYLEKLKQHLLKYFFTPIATTVVKEAQIIKNQAASLINSVYQSTLFDDDPLLFKELFLFVLHETFPQGFDPIEILYKLIDRIFRDYPETFYELIDVFNACRKKNYLPSTVSNIVALFAHIFEKYEMAFEHSSRSTIHALILIQLLLSNNTLLGAKAINDQERAQVISLYSKCLQICSTIAINSSNKILTKEEADSLKGLDISTKNVFEKLTLDNVFKGADPIHYRMMIISSYHIQFALLSDESSLYANTPFLIRIPLQEHINLALKDYLNAIEKSLLCCELLELFFLHYRSKSITVNILADLLPKLPLLSHWKADSLTPLLPKALYKAYKENVSDVLQPHFENSLNDFDKLEFFTNIYFEITKISGVDFKEFPFIQELYQLLTPELLKSNDWIEIAVSLFEIALAAPIPISKNASNECKFLILLKNILETPKKGKIKYFKSAVTKGFLQGKEYKEEKLYILKLGIAILYGLKDDEIITYTNKEEAKDPHLPLLLYFLHKCAQKKFDQVYWLFHLNELVPDTIRTCWSLGAEQALQAGQFLIAYRFLEELIPLNLFMPLTPLKSVIMHRIRNAKKSEAKSINKLMHQLLDMPRISLVERTSKEEIMLYLVGYLIDNECITEANSWLKNPSLFSQNKDLQEIMTKMLTKSPFAKHI